MCEIQKKRRIPNLYKYARLPEIPNFPPEMTRLDNDEKATKRRRRETIRRKHKRLNTLYEKFQKAWADYQTHNTKVVPDILIEKVVDVTTKMEDQKDPRSPRDDRTPV